MEKIILGVILSATSPQFGDCDTAKSLGKTVPQFRDCFTIENLNKPHPNSVGQIPFPENTFSKKKNNEPLYRNPATENCISENNNSSLFVLIKSSIRINIFKEIKSDLSDYSGLENNWDNHYAISISKKVIENAIDFIKILDEDDLVLLKDTSMPNQNGTITFLVNDSKHKIRLSLEIGERLSNYYISNSDGIIKSSNSEFDILKNEDVTEMFTFYKSLKNN